MTDRRQGAVLNAQFKAAVKGPSEYIKYAMVANNMSTWYALLSGFSGNEDEYAGGEYLVRVELPNDFPFSPPNFFFMTPNGLYAVEKKVCISIGVYHKDQYRAALGASGFCDQLVSGLIGWKDMGGGIELQTTTASQKRDLAATSKSFNEMNNARYIDQVNESFAGYSSKWKLEDIPRPMAIKLGLVQAEPATENTANTSVAK